MLRILSLVGMMTSGVLAGCTAPATADAGEGRGAQPVWTRADPAGGRGLPYADAELAVFTTAFDRRVVALDARTGQPRWERTLAAVEGQNLPTGNVLGAGEVLVVPGWDLYGLDRATGEIRWTFAPADEFPAGHRAALDGTRVITPGAERRVYAVDAATGAQLWAANLGERPFAPVVDGGVVYLGTRGYIGGSAALGAGHAVALRAGDGGVLWRTPLPDAEGRAWLGGTNQAGALTPELFIVASTSGVVYGLERATGAVRWRHQGAAPYESGVALLEDVAVVAGMTGEILGLDAATGAVRWRRSTGGSSVSQQVTTGGGCALIVVSAVLCVDAAGALRWEHGGQGRGGADFFTPVASSGGLLFAGSATGFHALRLPG